MASAPPGACYLVLTHRHDLDLAITEAILRRGDVGWLGLIGSRTKRAALRAPAASSAASTRRSVDRMACPIGVPGIDGKQPEVIAVAVVAQLLQVAGPRRPPAREDAATDTARARRRSAALG